MNPQDLPDAAWTPEMMDAYAEEYAREQAASAQSQPEEGYTHEETK